MSDYSLVWKPFQLLPYLCLIICLLLQYRKKVGLKISHNIKTFPIPWNHPLFFPFAIHSAKKWKINTTTCFPAMYKFIQFSPWKFSWQLHAAPNSNKNNKTFPCNTSYTLIPGRYPFQSLGFPSGLLSRVNRRNVLEEII